MKFIKEITIDWYDNILKSFCIDSDNTLYYCCILALNLQTDQKIYLCINIKYLKGCDELKDIIKSNSFKENWSKLPELISLNRTNKTYLIKAKNLRTDQIELVRYKDNVDLPKGILWGEYPEVLEKATEFDNWWFIYQTSKL